jgi:hypothetical protein
LLRVECNQCHASAYTENGEAPDAALTCKCCPEPHDHAQAANECPGAGIMHEGIACPHPAPAACLVLTPEGEDCPGGHCGLGIPECTVCRPVTITVLALVMPAGAV